ncbi:hypothetical protein niasHS_000115 [Heterodera schachtii]|uniref:Integrase zinc-binding domain-containing protein n=1 Tax=Heterodera schachtii TaxID=97005 RepID=A0ABD2K6V6_HETSC
MQNYFLLPLLPLYHDNGLRIMHEKLRNPILNTLTQLQNAIGKEKEARDQKMNTIQSNGTMENVELSKKCTNLVVMANKTGSKIRENNSKEKNEPNELELDFLENFGVGAQKNAQKSAYMREWHDKYLADMEKVLGQKRTQPRNLLTEQKYKSLMEKVKFAESIHKTNGQVPKHLNSILKKYRVALVNGPSGEMAGNYLVENGTERIIISVAHLFNVLHKYHLLTGHRRSISMFNAVKKEYANITVESIITFLSGCQECKTGTKNERRMATLVKSYAHKTRRIDYSQFYRFGPDVIECRHCAYRRWTNSPGKPTNALRSHLKKYHMNVLKQYRIAILERDGGHSKTEDEESDQNGERDDDEDKQRIVPMPTEDEESDQNGERDDNDDNQRLMPMPTEDEESDQNAEGDDEDSQRIMPTEERTGHKQKHIHGMISLRSAESINILC